MTKGSPAPESPQVSPGRELQPEEIAAAMDGVLRPHETEPDRFEAFLPSPCVQNHAANLAFLADGSLACVWFGGTMEGMGDISVWMSRLPAGAGRWGQAIRLTDDPGRSEQNPILFRAPDGSVWLFHTSQPGGRQEECEIRHRTSLDGGASFGPSERLGDFQGVFVRQPLHIGPGGEWLLPGFRCVALSGRRWTGAEDTAVMLVSADRGATWRAQEVPESRGAVHMNPVKGGPGPMVAFYRNRFATSVLRSLSHDGGLTWSKPEPTPLPSNNSSIQAIRLRDERIAMMLNPVNAAMSTERRASLYDEIEGDGGRSDTGGAIWGVPRAPLSLVLSKDGVSFAERRDLETGSGYCLTNDSVNGLNREYSYPSILEGPDGRLHIAYTYHRRAIKYVCLRWDRRATPTAEVIAEFCIQAKIQN
jgi:predicted neuraminidase